MKPSFYANSQPLEAVRKVLGENIRGLEEEIGGLRRLARGLLERDGKAGRLGEAYSLAAYRLGEMIKAEKLLGGSNEMDEWAEEMLAAFDRMALEAGEPPVSEEARREALGGDTQLEVGERRLLEEIAAMRYVLRNTYKQAMACEETEDYVRMVEIYGSGCVRLARLLKMEGKEQGRLGEYLKGKVDQALREVSEEVLGGGGTGEERMESGGSGSRDWGVES